MANFGLPNRFALEHHGLHNVRNVYWNLPPSALVEQIISRKEGKLTNQGAILVKTGKHMGRSPNDKFIVKNNNKDDKDIWWGKINHPISPDKFNQLHQKTIGYFQGRDIFVQDMQAGTHPKFNLPIRIITDTAWQSLASQNLFVRLGKEKMTSQIPGFTLIAGLELHADPKRDGTNSETFIAIDLTKRLILIGGTGYAGEIKKSIFTIMHYYLPLNGVLSMHCSANIGMQEDTALFFGLSGTGKTTLSSDTDRKLIGDDEHGWTKSGIFNIEGGCYAKTINLSEKLEPVIWKAVSRYGTVLENAIQDPLTKVPDFEDNSITDNIRAAYPIHFIPNHVTSGQGKHPKNIFFLTADAYGVLPPISRLTPEQAMYYFLSGYTSKLAGTEDGLGKEPQATFSTCFAAPFLPFHPHVYAELLGEKVARFHSHVWLINTGWTGGPYGIGRRIPLPYTRSMVHAALDQSLTEIPFNKDQFFGLWIPESCPGVPKELLNPQSTWASPLEYSQKAKHLISLFQNNFKQFSNSVSKEINHAAPHMI